MIDAGLAVIRMPRTLTLQIAESAEDLKSRMDQHSKAVQRSKVQMLWWFQTGKATTVRQVAEWSGYHPSTLWRWIKQYREGGLDALLHQKPHTGRPRAITGEVLENLKRELDDPEGFESYTEVQRWLSLFQGQEVPYKTVHKTVRYYLKGKLKVPRPVSEKQEPGAVKAFKDTAGA